MPGWVYRHNAGRVFMLHIAGMTGILAIVKLEILRQINGDLALPFVLRQLRLITHRVIAVHQTITVIMGVGSLANDINNVLLKFKVHAQFGIIGCCITYNIKDDRSTVLHIPCIILVFQRNSRGVFLGRVDCAGIGIELFHILLSVNGDRVSVAALSITLNLTGGVGAGNQRVALALGRVGRLVVGALDGDIADQTAEVVLIGSGGLVGFGGRVLFPHSIQRGGSGHNDAAAGLIVCGRCTAVGVPSEEGIAVAGRRLRGNGESMGLLILRGRLVGLAGRCAGAAVGIIVQRESQQNGRAFEKVICGVLAVGKQGACALAASVAAASGPTDVVDLVIFNTLPDILCIGKTEGIVVDVVLAEVNGDVIAADA